MSAYPALPLDAWADTKDTLHRFVQIVGKVRLAHAPPRNHWWHVPLYLTARGTTTSPMWAGDHAFEIAFDHLAHELRIDSARGRSTRFRLPGLTVAGFHERLVGELRHLGIDAGIARPWPFDLEDRTPFAEDDRPRAYDTEAVTTSWRIFVEVGRVLHLFARGFRGKASPVHHFWHTFDLAHTRFSGRPAPVSSGLDPVSREAYSQEVVSVGFWFGDATIPEPAFYAYAAPAPDGLTDHGLAGPGAEWVELRGSPLALLRYDAVRAAADPGAAVLAFYASAYQAGATAGGWDVAALGA